MKEPREDDERLSALLEGRVEAREREDLLARLAAADDDYEVFTSTASVLRALEEEDARAQRRAVPPSMRKTGWPSARAAATVAGAVVLLLALAWALRGRGGPAVVSPLQLALRADTAGDGVRAGWALPTPEGAVRGLGRRGENDVQAVWAGAMLVELAVAVHGGDTAQIREPAVRLRRRLDVGADAAAPLRRIAERPDAPADSLNALLEQATQGLGRRLGREPLELGAWVQAARIAADMRNAAFFEDGGTNGMLRRAERLARGSDAAEAAVKDVRAALPTGATPRWEVLAASLRQLLSQLSG